MAVVVVSWQEERKRAVGANAEEVGQDAAANTLAVEAPSADRT